MLMIVVVISMAAVLKLWYGPPWGTRDDFQEYHKSLFVYTTRCSERKN